MTDTNPTDPTDPTDGTAAGARTDRKPRAPRKAAASKRTRKAVPPRDAVRQAKADIPTGTGRPPKSAELVGQITQLLALVGVALMMLDEFDGLVVINHAAKVADSVAAVAETSPGVKKAIESAVAGSAWSAVVLSALPIAIAIMANHGILPDGLREVGGVPIPDEPSGPAAASTPSPADGGGLASVAQMFAGATAA